MAFLPVDHLGGDFSAGVGGESNPVGLECFWKGVTSFLLRILDGEGLVIYPVAGAGEVDLGGDLTQCGGAEGE